MGKDQEDCQIKLLHEQVTAALQERKTEKSEQQKELEGTQETEQLVEQKKGHLLTLKTLKEHITALETELLLWFHII